MKQSATAHLAFLEKVFFKKHSAGVPLRGVEIFNLNLLRELGRMGYVISFPACESWKAVFISFFKNDKNVRPIYLPHCVHPALCAIAGALALIRLRMKHGVFGSLIIGNVGNGIIPAVRMLSASGSFTNMVLIAHRETSKRFLSSVSSIPGHIVAVCGKIAGPFSALPAAADVHVDYGIMNADDFHPSETADDHGGKVRFCVLGALDNAWKGADTAVSAFEKLPAECKSRAELHLMAYGKPPHFDESSGIYAYAWKDAGAVAPFLRTMDVMIVPSRDEIVMRETFSQAAVQGMLTGLPVIYSDLPVLSEKFDNGGGLCFDSEEKLSEEMVRLAGDPGLRMKLGRESRTTALERYVWSTADFARKYLMPLPESTVTV